ncbi:hypothetical protein TRAPUB_2685 [Trametes pubescens]|uniref:Uncharacterized protein n=1 Tax=Trametes pubescens TaxID=154538 RepID=A0A1M2VFR2_TRAPU|nr:hypothetical protein TRAPUB_2685 [Trametes pubescens]
MAFSNRFDGLDLTPAFTFPEQQTYGDSNHPFRISDDALAEPRQPNLWTTRDMMSFDQAGPSQLPAEDRRFPAPLDDVYASSSFSPAFGLFWGDDSMPYTASSGPSRNAGLEHYHFNFSVPEGFEASAWAYMNLPSGSSAQPSPEACEAMGEGGPGGQLPLPHNSEPQEWLGASSFLLRDEERLQDTQPIASSSGVSVRPSNSASPSSSPASHAPVAPAASGSRARQSRGKVSNAIAGPSRLVPNAPREATVQVEAPTMMELRRSSRKRTASTTVHAAPAVLAPPPAKMRKTTKGVASKVRQPAAVAVSTSAEQEGPVAGPSREAAETGPKPSTSKARQVKVRSMKGTKAKRARRTCESVNKHKVANMPSHICGIDGCTRVWNPYTHKENKEHLQGHFDAGDLESEVELVCVFNLCQEVVPGKDLLKHMENHIGLPYLCPIRCGWRTSRSSYQTQHMHREHKGVLWET